MSGWNPVNSRSGTDTSSALEPTRSRIGRASVGWYDETHTSASGSSVASSGGSTPWYGTATTSSAGSIAESRGVQPAQLAVAHHHDPAAGGGRRHAVSLPEGALHRAHGWPPHGARHR